MLDSLSLLIAGSICVLLSVVMFYRVSPRNGQPPSAWTKTEGRTTATALTIIVLLLAGGIMVAKAIVIV